MNEETEQRLYIDERWLLAEKKTVSKLLAPTKTSEKTIKLDDHMVCAVAGW